MKYMDMNSKIGNLARRRLDFVSVFLYLACLLMQTLYAFEDKELSLVWEALSDINHPTLEDYQILDQYLEHGHRPYFDGLIAFKHAVEQDVRLARMRRFKLLGTHQEMPSFEIHKIVNPEKGEQPQRCILLYGSHHLTYPRMLRTALFELKECGYSGDVLVRIGGFPNVEAGGLKLCHIPYAFKVAFLKEAQRLGYKEVLWLDTSMRPLTDLQLIFDAIHTQGYFFSTIGSLTRNALWHNPEAVHSLGINEMLYPEIPHISSAILGLNIDNERAVQLLDAWFTETERVTPYMTFFPEEVSLSVMAWRLHCSPLFHLEQILCYDDEFYLLPKKRQLQFFFDRYRK
jgi:hypothetical protein